VRTGGFQDMHNQMIMMFYKKKSQKLKQIKKHKISGSLPWKERLTDMISRLFLSMKS
jgi:hypothetical protein